MMYRRETKLLLSFSKRVEEKEKRQEDKEEDLRREDRVCGEINAVWGKDKAEAARRSLVR